MEPAERQTAAGRITIGLLPKVATELDRLQELTGMSKTDLINRAVTLSVFVTEQLHAGNELLVREPQSGTVERVHLL